ncbi:hypothetical protein BN946_scf184392.g7 [Trametes cinnabarina]|uniref:Uncharacterized protein n=1 Tax=Pycnoporus cinnabarinus TaxID=5643 RepID=A0A060SJQ2_PYCCI|nr:hypothetical protein BN946_scf184392.g7 [Trametes cinnabarina]
MRYRLVATAEHLPTHLRERRISKGFYEDYANLVRAIGNVLRRPGAAGIPTATSVQDVVGGGASHFFAQGGRVEHAMDYVLRCAIYESPSGDGTWDELQEDSAGGGNTDSVGYAELPKCLEFIRVAERLSLQNLDRYRSRTAYAGGDDMWGGDLDDEEDEELDEDF